MAKKQIEIIKKIEAEARIIKPKVLSSKRSAFLNKRPSATCFDTAEVESQQLQILPTHCWSICNIRDCDGKWVTPNNPWIQGQQYGPFAFQTNPFNPTWSGTWTAQTPEFDAFYQWVVSEVGNINVGDTMQFDMSVLNSGMCNILGVCAEVLCFKYEGLLNWSNGFGWAVTNPTLPIAILDNCCDYVSDYCYDIGDTGPEGGTIFAVPLGHPQNNGVNQTNFYYEVAKNDIAIGGTPSTGFNLTCGDSFTTTQSIPNMAVNGFALIAPGTYSFNIGDEITSLTPGLFPPGTTIVSGNPLPISGLTSFIASNSANFTGPPHTIILTSTQLVSGWSASGAEWGVHNKPNIVTSTDFGTGHKNTDEIDSYPSSPGNPTGGIHPWLDTHDIAATLCKQKEGYFLPSYQEFREMVDASVAYGFNLALNTSTQSSENYYWTSSHRLPPSAALPDPHKYAWAYNTDTDNLELAYRCHALSVRPIRRFECEPEPLEPCPSPPDCNFEYNYRDGYSNVDGGFNLGGGLINPNTYSGYTGDPSAIHWNTTNEGCTPGTPPVTIGTDSTIGSEHCTIYLNRHDVLGNVFSDADFNNHTGYTISAWDTKYNFMGKWKYSNLLSLISTSSYFSYDRPQMANGNLVLIKLRNVQHLEGDYPVVYYAGKPDIPNSMGSLTAIFLKIEWDGNTGTYETGCNSTIFGNPHPYYSPINGKDWPYYCGPLYNPYGATGMNTSIPRYATFPPLDAAGNTLTVYPDLYTANPYYTSSTFPWNFPIGQAGSCDTPPVVIQNHCFSICAVHSNGTWYDWGDSWFGGEPYGPIAMENNPQPGVTTPPFSLNPPVDQDYTAFYDWILTQMIVTNLNPGDTFLYVQSGYTMQFQVTDPTTGQTYTLASVDRICFKYRGIQTYNVPLNMINDGYPTPAVHFTPSGCCVSSGPASLMIPVEDDPRSIKLKVNAKTPTKRQRFIGNKQPKNTGPFGIFGYYPLYDNVDDAIKNSPDSSYHIHEFGGQEYYMPNGLGGPGSGLQFHGDWEPKKPIINIENFEVEDGIDPEEQITQPEQQRITPPPVVIPEPEETYIPPPTPPPPSSTPTYTPPPSTSSGGSGGGGY